MSTLIPLREEARLDADGGRLGWAVWVGCGLAVGSRCYQCVNGEHDKGPDKCNANHNRKFPSRQRFDRVPIPEALLAARAAAARVGPAEGLVLIAAT